MGSAMHKHATQPHLPEPPTNNQTTKVFKDQGTKHLRSLERGSKHLHILHLQKKEHHLMTTNLQFPCPTTQHHFPHKMHKRWKPTNPVQSRLPKPIQIQRPSGPKRTFLGQKLQTPAFAHGLTLATPHHPVPLLQIIPIRDRK